MLPVSNKIVLQKTGSRVMGRMQGGQGRHWGVHFSWHLSLSSEEICGDPDEKSGEMAQLVMLPLQA